MCSIFALLGFRCDMACLLTDCCVLALISQLSDEYTIERALYNLQPSTTNVKSMSAFVSTLTLVLIILYYCEGALILAGSAVNSAR